jgi:hypothetical protein
MIAGIDYSTRFVDVVLLDENTDAAEWRRFPLEGADAFDRARRVRTRFPGPAHSMWDDVLAIGIEEPRGYNSGALYRVQGAILACVAAHKLVQPWIPSAWRKTVGLPGNASKLNVAEYVSVARWGQATAWGADSDIVWPQDACDAYCIALATRMSIQVTA